MKVLNNFFYVGSMAFCIVFSFGFITYESYFIPERLRIKESFMVMVEPNTTPHQAPNYFTPILKECLIGFKEALAFKESQGNYFAVNDLGYLGKYQFGIETLKLMGVYSENKFLHSPQLQEEVFLVNLKRNKWILRKDIKRSVGKIINNIKVTESGILAAAHLAGAGNVKKYLRSQGHSNVADVYGTKLSDYLCDFSGYDMTKITAFKNPKINTQCYKWDNFYFLSFENKGCVCYVPQKGII